ncbi:MAG TPA: hypothetical protein PKH10_04140 [bacterium]|nr:hypothetical protein [bacterium]
MLNSKQVEYLLVGGYAVGYYGYPRATADIDVWIAVSEQNAGRIVSALREFGFAVPDLKPELFLQKGRVIRMGVPPIRIEVITSASGVDFAECYSRRLVVEMDGIPVSLIELTDLKRNKKAAGRPKDLADLAQLA